MSLIDTLVKNEFIILLIQPQPREVNHLCIEYLKRGLSPAKTYIEILREFGINEDLICEKIRTHNLNSNTINSSSSSSSAKVII